MVKIRVKPSEESKEDLAQKLLARRERLHKEAESRREKEIEQSLSEIYRDKDGRKIDVNRLKINRKQGFVFWFFNFLVLGLVAIVIALGAYYYIVFGRSTDSTAIDLKVEAKEAISAGEEFSYTIKYRNQEYVTLKNVSLKVEYPENFIFLEALPNPEAGNKEWKIGRVAARSEGEIVIKGKVIDKVKTSSILLVQMVYTPENFSSEFKKETSFTAVVKDVGFESEFDYSNTALVGEEDNLAIGLKPLANNFLPDFIVRLEKGKNVEIRDTLSSKGINDPGKTRTLKVEKVKDAAKDTWLVSGLEKKEDAFAIRYKVKEKIDDKEKIKISFYEQVGGKEYVFLEKEMLLEVMKSDLNLTLIQNGARDNRPANFEDKLNYSIVFKNKGEAAMKDVMIMAILDSAFLDWTTLEDKNGGREKGNTITWSKDQIPSLEKIDVNKEGVIDFSISVLPFKESDLGKDFKIVSYAQYAIGSLEDVNGEDDNSTPTKTASSSDNRSNTITNIINSDLGFKEEVRYFDDSNLPVGNGPLPPKVGEKTSFKVFWTINNNLHDLNDVRLETVLPENVGWDERNRTSVGTITFDPASRKVVWDIGRLPITVFRADAEFNIALTPKEEDRNKIVVLLAGSSIKAIDSKTESEIEKTSLPKTSKLEDDEIANMSSDGRVK